MKKTSKKAKAEMTPQVAKNAVDQDRATAEMLIGQYKVVVAAESAAFRREHRTEGLAEGALPGDRVQDGTEVQGFREDGACDARRRRNGEGGDPRPDGGRHP